MRDSRQTEIKFVWTYPGDDTTSVRTLTDEVFYWAENTFPQRTDVSMFLKFYGEIAEMIESGGDTDEIADVFILLLDYARRKNIDVATAVRRKLEVNRSRRWVTNVNGVNRHVE